MRPTLRRMSGLDGAARRAPPGQGQAWRRKEMFRGFSWHSCEGRTVLQARCRIDKIRDASTRETAVHWAGFRELPDGFYLPWRKPATYGAGYSFFFRALRNLVWEPGQSSGWRVSGHPQGLTPQLVSGSLAAPRVRRRLHLKRSRLPSPCAKPADTARRPLVHGAGPFSACPPLLLTRTRAELEQREKAYVFEGKLGEGTFGKVYRVRVVADGQTFVAKALKRDLTSLQDAFAEALALDRCRGHPHVPAFLDVFMGKRSGQIYLVLQHAGRDLQQVLEEKGNTFSSATARMITQHVALALQCLHGQGLLHADVKPLNILVETLPEDCVAAKLTDFGSVMEAGMQRVMSGSC